MRNLLDFLLKYNYCLLFVLLEVICFILLFRFNSYQGSVFFTSANRIAGEIYDLSSEVTRYIGLGEVNRQLTRRNVELETGSRITAPCGNFLYSRFAEGRKDAG